MQRWCFTMCGVISTTTPLIQLRGESNRGVLSLAVSASDPDTQEFADALSTRERILQLIITDGPISANEVAKQLQLTAAGIRRHLSELQTQGHIVLYEPVGKAAGPGRPARFFIATPAGQNTLAKGYEKIAVAALQYVKQRNGQAAIDEFAASEMEKLQTEIAPALENAGDDMEQRAEILAQELSRRGYAATVRSVPGAPILQLCQGHCPVQDVASQFPEICEAETRIIAETLGVHVQRLATIASGEHVCTTSIPIAELARTSSQNTAAISGRPEGN